MFIIDLYKKTFELGPEMIVTIATEAMKQHILYMVITYTCWANHLYFWIILSSFFIFVLYRFLKTTPFFTQLLYI